MAVSDVPEPRLAPRCDHCGRAVHETCHTATSYRVDYYSLHTGEVEESTLTTESGTRVSFFKLLAPVEIITCATCYESAAVRHERDERFRPERTAARQGGDVSE